jgi:thiamine pyrophosphate-dependent acetolactate synthase large subunit-like protein
VIGFSGDGGSMYTIQALWTAARITASREVRDLQQPELHAAQAQHPAVLARAGRRRRPRLPEELRPARPAVTDFANMAEAMGVRALRVDHPDQVEDAVRAMLDHQGPFLIDLVISDQLPA